MCDEITNDLMNVLEKLRKEKPSREVSLAITKVEEALMWWAKRK